MTDEEACQARFRYERATTEARHARDMAISAAWIAFERTVGEEWAVYQKATQPFVEALQLRLEGTAR